MSRVNYAAHTGECRSLPNEYRQAGYATGPLFFRGADDATDFFEPFAKANDRDFDEHETGAYTLVIPSEEPISQYFFRIFDDASEPHCITF